MDVGGADRTGAGRTRSARITSDAGGRSGVGTSVALAAPAVRGRRGSQRRRGKYAAVRRQRSTWPQRRPFAVGEDHNRTGQTGRDRRPAPLRRPYAVAEDHNSPGRPALATNSAAPAVRGRRGSQRLVSRSTLGGCAGRTRSARRSRTSPPSRRRRWTGAAPAVSRSARDLAKYQGGQCRGPGAGSGRPYAVGEDHNAVVEVGTQVNAGSSAGRTRSALLGLAKRRLDARLDSAATPMKATRTYSAPTSPPRGPGRAAGHTLLGRGSIHRRPRHRRPRHIGVSAST